MLEHRGVIGAKAQVVLVVVTRQLRNELYRFEVIGLVGQLKGKRRLTDLADQLSGLVGIWPAPIDDTNPRVRIRR
jgi:hypothetical protein